MTWPASPHTSRARGGCRPRGRLAGGWHTPSTRKLHLHDEHRRAHVRPCSAKGKRRGRKAKGGSALSHARVLRASGLLPSNWCGLPAAAPAGKTALVGGLPVRTRRTAPQRPLTRPCLPLGRPAPKASPQGPVGGCAAAVRPGRSRRCCGLAHAGGPAADRPLSQPHGHARRGRGAADRHDRAGATARSTTSAGRRHLPNQGARTESNWKKVLNRAHL